MSGNESADEQSEDGELRQSPIDPKYAPEPETMDFSISEEEEGETVDSLDIKPPQAKASAQSKTKKRDHERRKHTDRRRDDRHSHRDKHHREKPNRSLKDREQYQRDKERYYREKHFEQQAAGFEAPFRERKDEKSRGRHSDQRKHEEKKLKESRHRDVEKREYFEETRKSKGDKDLNDLRERLLSKRKGEYVPGGRDKSSRKDRKHREHLEDPLQGEAGMLVKEIISLTTEEKKKIHKDDDPKMTEEERAETEQRKQKFLEAAKEMSRLKEQSRVERERRQEKASKRKHEEDVFGKRQKVEEAPVVVSDNSDGEQEEIYQPNTYESDKSPEEEPSPSPVPSEHSRISSRSGGDESPYSDDRRSATRSRTRSRSPRSGSRSRSDSDRSRSRSPKSDDNDEEMLDEEKEKDDKSADKPKPKVDESLPPYYPAVQGCRSVEEFQCLNRIEEGTYGVVYRARDKRTDDIVALKRLKMEKEKEGFPITSLREINTLLKGQHPNIVTVREIVVGSNMDKIFIVMDYVEHDLKSLMETMRHKKQHFMPGEVYDKLLYYLFEFFLR
ncbi:unnamed protein product [Psylliodes chrysocephalus]|uniref:cyclin-dependent kinase n=1 Tax=Psylliodes chrysocephalus TaxID=3402493 RepID=A0A9P0D6E5_9CUCU|nr:unnamed protein product [Psylliodes chrysocephala]